MSKQSRRTREVKVVEMFDREVPTRRNTSPIQPRTANQEDYLDSINSKSLIFASGPAGCGKTYIAASKAADYLLDKTVEKIIVTRPVLSADEELGFLPGDINEKFSPYFRPVQDVLEERLGKGYFEYCMKVGRIEVAPFAYMRGRTFRNSFVLLDEAQNVTAKQMELFLTRIGDNCVVVVNGDLRQCDLPVGSLNGLGDALNRFPDDEDVAGILFDEYDCVRSNICRKALAAYKL